MGLILSDYLAITYHFLLNSMPHSLQMASVRANNSTVGTADFLIKGEQKSLFLLHQAYQDSVPEKNTIIPSPKGWFSAPAFMTSGETYAYQNLTSGWLHARSYDSWGEKGQFFLFPRGRIVRAVILNRARFTEWLRAPQRGSGKWPHLYSDKNWLNRTPGKNQKRPCADAPRDPPPLHLFTTSKVELGGSTLQKGS